MENQNTDKEKSCESRTNWFAWFWACVFITILLWVGSGYWIDQKFPYPTNSENNVNSENDVNSARGTFGDKFGAINALFSGIAAAGMIITLWMQKNELELQRKELEDTNTALENQGNIMAEQLRLSGISQLESTLFYMLGQHNNIINGISGLDWHGNARTGIDYINHWTEFVKNDTKEYYIKISPQIANYANNLFQIFKYIDNVEILKNEQVDKEYDDRHKYCSIVTSVLTYNELILLRFYVKMSGTDMCNEFENLCYKYALYENIGMVEDEYNLKEEYCNAKYNPEMAKELFLSKVKNKKGVC